MIAEGYLGSCLDLGPIRALLKHLLREEEAGEDGRVCEDCTQLQLSVLLREVDDCYRLEAIVLEDMTGMPQSHHLEKFARVGCATALRVAASLEQCSLAVLFLHEPDEAVALGLEGLLLGGDLG